MRRTLALISCLVASSAARAEVKVEGPLWTEGPSAKTSGAASNAPLTMSSFARLSRSLGPAIVNITTVQVGEAREGQAPQKGRGQGTGFIIHRAGLILTNHHVVDSAEQIKVRLDDDRELPGRIIGRDERTDIALLQVDAGGPLPVAPLGDSDKVEIGEWVLAIGNPFGLDHTVTVGIVSAKGRRDVRPGGQTNGFYDFIQTDASINAGNSGGPLINVRGEVIGINTAMNAQGQGIAFAIPINMAKAIVPLLARHGHAPRSWLGLYTQPVTTTLARAFALPDMRGALVSEVVEGSPAAQAGIVAGDLVLDFDGRPIRRADDLKWLESTAGAGRRVPLTIVRGRGSRKVQVTLAAAPEEKPPAPPVVVPRGHTSPLGITVSEINPGIAREIGQPDARGLVVMGIEPESPAAEAGVERGDILLRVGDAVVRTVEDYAGAVRSVEKGGMIKLLARRSGRSVWLAFPKR